MSKPILTVGRLRQLIQSMPDDANIVPEWNNGPPSDDEPAVVICGFQINNNNLEVLVDIMHLDEFEVQEDDE